MGPNVTPQHRILVIDDDTSTGKTICAILNKKGYLTETASSGKEGLELLEKKSFIVALVDINLPDINGIELLQSLKTLSPNMEEIVITGNSSIETAKKALAISAFAYLVKPIDMDQLLLYIERAIEKKTNEINLDTKIRELENFLDLSKYRESKKDELKKEINSLLEKSGKKKRY